MDYGHEYGRTFITLWGELDVKESMNVNSSRYRLDLGLIQENTDVTTLSACDNFKSQLLTCSGIVPENLSNRSLLKAQHCI
jgi:hypothetical protein